MKFAGLLPFILFSLHLHAQNFGEFASAVFVGECYSESFYNTSGSGSNCVNPSCGVLFDGQNFGSYIQNSAELYLRGAEIKTWKNSGGNVCGATLHYRVYPTGSPSGAFSSFNIPYKSNCCGAVFCDGLGGCGGNDQKWSQEALSPLVDLTTFAPGNWSVEVYISYTGDDFSSGGMWWNQVCEQWRKQLCGKLYHYSRKWQQLFIARCELKLFDFNVH